MTADELRRLLRQHTKGVVGLDAVEVIPLKNGQLLGVVLVGQPRAGNGVKLIIEEREHGTSKKETTDEPRQEDRQEKDGEEKDDAQEDGEEKDQEESREKAGQTIPFRGRKGGPSKGRPR